MYNVQNYKKRQENTDGNEWEGGTTESNIKCQWSSVCHLKTVCTLVYVWYEWIMLFIYMIQFNFNKYNNIQKPKVRNKVIAI